MSAARYEGCEPCGECPACAEDGRAYYDARALRRALRQALHQMTRLRSALESERNAAGPEDVRSSSTLQEHSRRIETARRVGARLALLATARRGGGA